jgi:spore coat polysaccharide biosynthesis protein SpsF
VKTVAIVQARMTSTRLPGKILMEVLGKPLLQYELERLRKIRSLDEIVVATTDNASDDLVADFCAMFGAPVYRGSELDVLSRYYEAARLYSADVVVRFTADCPFVDHRISERVIRRFLDNKNDVDYCAVDVEDARRPYPRGVDTEVFSMSTLAEAFDEAKLESEREHVTPFIYSRPERYRIWRAKCDEGWGRYRLTVDTPEDFELVKKIIENLYPANPDFTLREIIELLQKKPELPRINEFIEQKR